MSVQVPPFRWVWRVVDKLARLREFANATFPDEEHRFQWWSPVVAKGATTARFDELCAAWTQEGRSLEFVINDEYTRRIDALVRHADRNPSATSEPAYRMLQILTSLRGERPKL